ncbi:hypothetical protein KSP39_PZI019451 [Platanthera zijinensis]|uniref:Tf2-1-like SH3-like domain-containing protein n=1 Tax=Platanthera zijinensis TaxID=2320716 RepID=A0AAP0B2D7_9ASPA
MEDMLRMCALDFGKRWEDYIFLVEFAYNNSYQASIGMAPFEALYGRKCRTPLAWAEAGESKLNGKKEVEEATSLIRSIRERLLIAQDRQAKYYNAKHRNVEFAVGDWVYLKIKPFKGVSRIRRLKKLSPRYLGPFEVVERVGEAAYRLALSADLGGLHDVFHISVLRKAVKEAAQVVENDRVPVEYGLTTRVRPIRIEDRAEKQLRNKVVGMVKVRWDNCDREELTWEREQTMRAEFPELFNQETSAIHQNWNPNASHELGYNQPPAQAPADTGFYHAFFTELDVHTGAERLEESKPWAKVFFRSAKMCSASGGKGLALLVEPNSAKRRAGALRSYNIWVYL